MRNPHKQGQSTTFTLVVSFKKIGNQKMEREMERETERETERCI